MSYEFARHHSFKCCKGIKYFVPCSLGFVCCDKINPTLQCPLIQILPWTQCGREDPPPLRGGKYNYKIGCLC